MGFLNSDVIPALPTGGYQIDQSLRFNDDDSAFLSRTPASAGNRRTWTWSGWVKLGQSDIPALFGAFTTTGGPNTSIYFSGDQFKIRSFPGSNPPDMEIYTEAVFRDYSAWYHLVVSVDTTQATTNDRVKMYVNGEEQAVTRYISPSQNYDTYINSTNQHDIGRYVGYSAYCYHGYLSEVHFIDGQALDPSYFGETDETYGHWKPIEYTGTYGTNGFYLPFSGTFYNDASGNGNNWTANNLATTDVVLDSPTNNFCTLNPLSKSSSSVLAEGNLKWSSTTYNYQGATSTICLPSSGKWYWETNIITGGTPLSDDFGVGVQSLSFGTSPKDGNTITDGAIYISRRDYASRLLVDNSIVQMADTYSFSTGDVVQVAYDASTGKIWFGRNNTWWDASGGSTGNPSSGTNPVGTLTAGDIYLPVWDGYTNTWVAVINFGQDSSFAGNKTAQNNTDANGYGDFYYSPPSGFLALCTANLSDPAVVPGENFNTVLYAGNGGSQSITGVGFQPDWTWIKSRSGTYGAYNATAWDVVRGVGANKELTPNQTYAEGAANTSQYGYVSSLDSDGFTLTAGSTNSTQLNGSSTAYVAWSWKADNTSGSTNNDGSITSTVAANVDAGFSIVSYTGTGSAATVGHGLSSAPEIFLVKGRNFASNWFFWHKDMSSSNYYLRLNATDGESVDTTWLNGDPTSSVVNLGTSYYSNYASNAYIAYCFHSVDGYSKFGSYTGNGSSDGSFIYTGFRPAFVMVKQSSASGESWVIHDSKRTPNNVDDDAIFPNVSNAETSAASYSVDVLSNGFKLRNSHAVQNSSGATYIYMSFAEYPFKYTNAR